MNNAQINDKVYVSSGGVITDSDIMRNGGQVYISSGGSGLRLSAFGNGFPSINEGSIIIGSDGIVSDSFVDGGYMSIVGTDAEAVNTTITGRGWQDVGYNNNGSFGQGKATETHIKDNSYQFIYNGGVANNTYVSSGSYQTLQETGAKSYNTEVFSDGHLVVSSGASTFNPNIHSGGTGYISSGGTVFASDGKAIGVIIDNGFGIATSGGEILNVSGINNAYLEISSGGKLTSAVMSSYSWAVTHDGGYADSVEIFENSKLVLSGGDAANIIVRGSGFESAGNATAGRLEIGSGASVQNAAIDGGYVAVRGTANNVRLTNAGWMDVGLDVFNNNMNAGSDTAIATHIEDRGRQFIFSTGTARQTYISSGGTQVLGEAGATAYDSTVFSGGAVLLSSGTVLSNGTIERGGLLSAAPGGIYGGHISVAGIVSGGTVQSAGILEVVSGGTTTALTVASGGTLQIDAGGSLVGLASLAPGASATLDGNAGGTVDLGGNGYTRLTLTGTASPTSIISGFNGESPSASDQIILRDIPRSQIIGVDFPDDDHIEFVLSGDRRLRMAVPGAGKKPARYDLSDGPGNSTIFAVCFLAGTLIRTPEGERAVETIAPGDLVYVYHNGCQEIQRVTWVGQRSVECAESAGFEPTDYPVRVSASALGDGVPYKDLLITPEHCLYIDGALIPARMLVNGRSITHDTSLTRYSYHHIETQTHAVVMADGMLSETYLDTGNRNGLCSVRGGVAPGATVEASQSQPAMAAPLDVSRAFVEPIWHRLARRAGVERISRKTGESTPRLHLRTEAGEILQTVRKNGGCHVFHLPEGCSMVHICSPAARPSEAIGPFVDDRRMLGVLIEAMTLYAPDGATEIGVRDFLYHARGWYAPEGNLRWTNGCAVLPVGQFLEAQRRVLAINILSSGPIDVAKEI